MITAWGCTDVGCVREHNEDSILWDQGGPLLAFLRSQASFDVAKIFPTGQLRECHREILIETRETLDLVLSTVTRHASPKRRQRHMLSDLREYQFPEAHRHPLRIDTSQGRKSVKSRPG